MHSTLPGGKKRNMSTFYTVTLVTTNQDVFCVIHIFLIIWLQIKLRKDIREEQCRMCKKIVGENSQFRTYHRARCLARMRCNGCSVRLTELGSKDRILNFCCHVILCLGDGIYKCPNCPKQGATYTAIKEHHDKCKKNIICHVCNRDLKYPEKLKEHVEKKHPKIQCEICATVFLTESALKDHASVHK